MAGENAIWPSNMMFVIVKFFDNSYTTTPNFHFKNLYVACFE